MTTTTTTNTTLTINVHTTALFNIRMSVANDAKHLSRWQANTQIVHDNWQLLIKWY